MTEVPVESGFAPADPSVYERVAGIASADLTPDEQWCAIERIDMGPGNYYPDDPGCSRRYEDDPGDTATALIDFALDPQSSPSALVRVYALEQGMLRLRKAIEDDPHVRERVRPDISFRYMELEDGLRDLFDSNLRSELHGGHHKAIAPPRREQIDVYRDAAIRLAKIEGLSPYGTLFPAWDTSEFEGYTTASYSGIPLLPFLLMEYHAGNGTVTERSEAPLVNFMTSEMLHDTLSAALMPHHGDWNNGAGRTAAFSRLTRYARVGGREHVAPLDTLYQIAGDERDEYVATLNSLYEQSEGLGYMFPAVRPATIVSGFHNVAANGLFALAEHIRNGEHTDAQLQLLGGNISPVQYEGKEPLELLRHMKLTQKAHELMTHPDTEVDLVVDEASFVIYSFRNHMLPDHPRVMKYIRPEGGFDINYRYEYGSRRWGVQASTDLRIDAGGPLNPAKPYHKASMSPDSLSVRLDREGRSPALAVPMSEQDPTREDGTISLDVGSIMGVGLGSRIGRFLAWGNVLRSLQTGDAPRLNHITDTLDQSLGNADAFKKMALDEIVFWEELRQNQNAGSVILMPPKLLRGLGLVEIPDESFQQFAGSR